MAFLKNSVVAGDLRVTGTIHGDANLSSINANNTGLGTNGQILKSTGTGIVWTDANISGNATTATTLQTARKINDTSFNGSADITTAKWGTARNISISDSDGTNTGTAVSVNGSAAVTLKLPATIKGSLTGNAFSVGNGSHGAAVSANEFNIPVGSATIVGNVSNTSMAHTNNANAEMIIKTHPSSGTSYYEARLGFSSNGSLYYMPVNTTSWKTIAYTSSNITGTAANVTGTVAIANGGTGAITAAAARTNLGITPANIGAATSDHNHDDDYVNVSGDTMTGGLTLSNGSSAYNDKGLLFTNGSRIGENSGGDLGIYAADGLYIKPSSPTASSSTEGIRITSNGLYPCVNNTELLGLSDNKWSNVYATTFTGNLNGISNGGIYLVSSTVAATAAKTASYTGFTLLTGSNIYIIFNETNTQDAPTLNVNSTGAKPIYYKGVRVTYQGIATGILYHMIYDGTNWQIVNNITPQMGTCSTGASTNPKTATCLGFVPYTGASFKIKFTVTNTNPAPTLDINSTGAKPVNWIGATNDVKHRLLEDHVYEFVYDGTNYNIVAPTIRHYATSGTAGTEGSETIAIGNSETTTEDGNLRGKILLYGTSSNYTTIMSYPNGNNNVYFPHYNGTMYLTHAGGTGAVGASTKPVYVAANGRITKCSTIGSVTNEVWSVNFS